MKYVASPDLRVFDYLDKSTKPTTVIYENAVGLAANLVAEDGSIGIRIVQDEFCKHLIKRFRKPIVSTSANLSGQPTPANYNDISPAIKNAVDYVVEYRQDDSSISSSSSIIKWKNGEAIIVR
jgi:L-threonylcarbamoyladenylate synthase